MFTRLHFMMVWILPLGTTGRNIGLESVATNDLPLYRVVSSKAFWDVVLNYAGRINYPSQLIYCCLQTLYKSSWNPQWRIQRLWFTFYRCRGKTKTWEHWVQLQAVPELSLLGCNVCRLIRWQLVHTTDPDCLRDFSKSNNRVKPSLQKGAALMCWSRTKVYPRTNEQYGTCCEFIQCNNKIIIGSIVKY